MRWQLPILVLLLMLVVAPATVAAQSAPVSLAVALEPGARLGGRAELRIRMFVDVARLRSPATEIRILAPRGVDVATSRLGTATCPRPQVETTAVLVYADEWVDCPRNSFLGAGEASAALIFNPEDRPIIGTGSIRLFAGGVNEGEPGLTVLAETRNPAVMQLSYVGQLLTAQRPHGLTLRLIVRPLPQPIFGATLALARMEVRIGAPSIVYSRTINGKPVYYHPGGVVLPERCGRGGWPFRVQLKFADGTGRAVDTTVPCPRRDRRPRGAPN